MAHGNFSEEVSPAQDAPAQSDVYIERNQQHAGGRPGGSWSCHSSLTLLCLGKSCDAPSSAVSTASEEGHTYLAVIIGVLMAVVLLLAAAIYLIVSRHRQRKCFASPLAAKVALASTLGSASGTMTASEKGASYGVKEVDDNCNRSAAESGVAGVGGGTLDPLLVAGDYQEPYQALKYAPYYSYSSVVMEMGGTLDKCFASQAGEWLLH